MSHSDTMISKLVGLMPYIKERLYDISVWDSMVVNLRKPHTYRVWTMFDELRVCLHRFEACNEEEAFVHPHTWPGAFMLLEGSYIHKFGVSPDLSSAPEFFMTQVLQEGCVSEMYHNRAWHSVQPTETCYTIMVNGPPWKEIHERSVTTKGKDLDKMSLLELGLHLDKFKRLTEFMT